MYREVEKPKKPNKPSATNISPLVAPPVTSSNLDISDMLAPVPRGVGLCKNFDELKFYWADNYNVKGHKKLGGC